MVLSYSKKITRDRERYLIMIKYQIHQENETTKIYVSTEHEST